MLDEPYMSEAMQELVKLTGAVVSPGTSAGSLLVQAGSTLKNFDDERRATGFALYRKELREEVLAKAMLKGTPTTFTAYFRGDGGERYFDNNLGHLAVIDFLLQEMVCLNAGTDWYEGHGGEGRITWKVREDVFVINASYNEVIQHQYLKDHVVS